MNKVQPRRRAQQRSGAADAAPGVLMATEKSAKAVRGRNQTMVRKQPASNAARPSPALRVLHVGCGRDTPSALHPAFKSGGWDEIRLDIDQSIRPDIVASAADLSGQVEDESCDAIWSSHTLEHLHRHEVPLALSEFRRVLAPTGFVLIRSPDVEVVAQFIVDGRIDEVIYTSAAGPITPLDMLFGHARSIARGNEFMRHGTAFTQDLLARDLLEAGFAEVRTTRPGNYEVWAAAFMPDADVSAIVDTLAKAGLDLRDEP